MADFLGEGAAWLEDQRREHLTRSVTYRRSAQEVELPATKGRREFQITDESGLSTIHESTDWLLTAADLVIGGERVEPRRGDQIKDGEQIYEVLEMPGIPCWQWSDMNNLTIRVHSKLIKASP